MTFSIHGLAVSRGIAIGRAVLVASSRVDVAHYFIDASQVATEIDRVRVARNTVVDEIHRLQKTIAHMGPKEAPHELAALMDVHLLLLQDEDLIDGAKPFMARKTRSAICSRSALRSRRYSSSISSNWRAITSSCEVSAHSAL